MLDENHNIVIPFSMKIYRPGSAIGAGVCFNGSSEELQIILIGKIFCYER